MPNEKSDKSNKKRTNNTPTSRPEGEEDAKRQIENERASRPGAGSAGDSKRGVPEMSGPRHGEESRGGQHTDQ